MKITKRQLLQIIKEEKQKILAEQPISAEQGQQMTEYDLAQELIKTLKSARIGAELVQQGAGNTEVYIMTGAAEGITVKVVRRGR